MEDIQELTEVQKEVRLLGQYKHRLGQFLRGQNLAEKEFMAWLAEMDSVDLRIGVLRRMAA